MHAKNMHSLPAKPCSYSKACCYMTSAFLILRCTFFAATNARLNGARTKMILAISDMLRKEGVLYTMPPVARMEGQSADFECSPGSGAQGDIGLVGQLGVYNMMPGVTSLSAQ